VSASVATRREAVRNGRSSVRSLVDNIDGLVDPLVYLRELLSRAFLDSPDLRVEWVYIQWIRTDLKPNAPDVPHSEPNDTLILISFSVDGRYARILHGLEEVDGHPLVRVETFAGRAESGARQPPPIGQAGMRLQPIRNYVAKDIRISRDIRVIVRQNPTF
jgi:hypothetical protein